MTEPLILDVTFEYSQRVFPVERGDNYIRGYAKDWIGTGSVAVDRADGSEFERVATLGFADGGSFTLLSRNGSLYRPVMAPGLHKTMDEDALAEAAKASVPWRDDPLRIDDRGYAYGRDTNDAPKTAIDGALAPDPQNWRKLGDSTRKEYLDRIAVRAGAVVVVDGIVHVACPEPVLVLKTVDVPPPEGREGDKPGKGLRLEWHLPRMEGDDDPVTGPTTVKKESTTPSYHDVRGRGMRRHEPKPQKATGPRIEWTARPWRTFGLADLDEARRFGAALAAESGIPFEDRPDLAVLHEPGLLSEGPQLDVRLVAANAYNSLCTVVRKLSREGVLDWLDARDADEAKDQESLVAAVVRAVSRPADRKLMTWGGTTELAVLSSGSYGDAYGRDGMDSMANLLRHVLVERDRAPAPGMDEADADAFAEVGGLSL